MREQEDKSIELVVKSALEVLKDIDVPAFQPLPIEHILRESPLHVAPKHNPYPAFAAFPALIVLTLGIFVAIPFIQKQLKIEHPGIPTSCLIQSVSGKETRIQNTDGKSGEETARAGMFLEERSRIRTGADSEIHLRAGVEVNLIVSQNSYLEMTQLRMGETGLSKEFLFSLNEGHVYCEVDGTRKDGARKDGARKSVALSILTPEAQFQVWGTKFEIVSDPQLGTHLGVLEGDVLITPKAKNAEPLHVLGGFQTQVSRGKSFKAPVIMPLTEIYYKPLISLEKIISGEQQDENSDGILSTVDNFNAESMPRIDQMFEDKDIKQ